MKPENNPASFYLVATGTAAEVGCLLVAGAGGAILLGLLIDRLLGTNHIFVFLLLLASIPLNLWIIYRYTIYKTRRLQGGASTLKEDTANDD